jgi:hypothetical protein
MDPRAAVLPAQSPHGGDGWRIGRQNGHRLCWHSGHVRGFGAFDPPHPDDGSDVALPGDLEAVHAAEPGVRPGGMALARRLLRPAGRPVLTFPDHRYRLPPTSAKVR